MRTPSRVRDYSSGFIGLSGGHGSEPAPHLQHGAEAEQREERDDERCQLDQDADGGRDRGGDPARDEHLLELCLVEVREPGGDAALDPLRQTPRLPTNLRGEPDGRVRNVQHPARPGRAGWFTGAAFLRDALVSGCATCGSLAGIARSGMMMGLNGVSSFMFAFLGLGLETKKPEPRNGGSGFGLILRQVTRVTSSLGGGTADSLPGIGFPTHQAFARW